MRPNFLDSILHSSSTSGVCLLAVGGLGAVFHINKGLGGLLGVAGLLGGSDNAAILGGLHANGLKWEMESIFGSRNYTTRKGKRYLIVGVTSIL